MNRRMDKWDNKPSSVCYSQTPILPDMIKNVPRMEDLQGLINCPSLGTGQGLHQLSWLYHPQVLHLNLMPLV